MSAAPIGRTSDLDSEWHTVDLVVPNPANRDPSEAEKAALIAKVNNLEARIFRLDIEIKNTQDQNTGLIQARDDHTREIQRLTEQTERLNLTITNIVAQNNLLREQLTAENNRLREQVRLRDVAIRDLMQHEHRPDATIWEVVACILGITRCKLACEGIAH